MRPLLLPTALAAPPFWLLQGQQATAAVGVRGAQARSRSHSSTGRRRRPPTWRRGVASDQAQALPAPCKDFLPPGLRCRSLGCRCVGHHRSLLGGCSLIKRRFCCQSFPMQEMLEFCRSGEQARRDANTGRRQNFSGSCGSVLYGSLFSSLVIHAFSQRSYDQPLPHRTCAMCCPGRRCCRQRRGERRGEADQLGQAAGRRGTQWAVRPPQAQRRQRPPATYPALLCVPTGALSYRQGLPRLHPGRTGASGLPQGRPAGTGTVCTGRRVCCQ